MGPTLTSLILVAPGYLKHAAEHFGMALPRADLNLMMEPPFQALQRLQRLHIAAMRFVLEEPEMLGRAEAMRSLEWAILEALLVCLTGSALQPPSRARLSRENIMRRFDILLAANPDSNLIMSDVCRELGISTRLLRACCDDQLGMGPKQFLMLRRLHLVRRRLLASGGNRGGVTDIATEYGFWELGRFAVAYRELFGESPSVTLKRPPEIARKAMPAHHTVGDRLHQVKDWLGPQWYAARAMFERHQEAGEIA
jgi:AraC-like DNA-binding protein